MLSETEQKRRNKLEQKRRNKLEQKRRNSEKRRTSILNLIQTEIPFKQIAIKFNVTVQRISQLAIDNNIKRMDCIIDNCKNIFEAFMIDFNNGASINELLSKHKITKIQLNSIYARYKPKNAKPLSTLYRDKRNARIIEAYNNGETAQSILEKKDKVLGDPTKILTTDGIYYITVKHGIKRFPKIGNRSGGGCLESKKIIKLIVKLRENKLSFNRIAEKLNSLGYKTIGGKEFKHSTVMMKYNSYKKGKITL